MSLLEVILASLTSGLSISSVMLFLVARTAARKLGDKEKECEDKQEQISTLYETNKELDSKILESDINKYCLEDGDVISKKKVEEALTKKLESKHKALHTKDKHQLHRAYAEERDSLEKQHSKEVENLKEEHIQTCDKLNSELSYLKSKVHKYDKEIKDLKSRHNDKFDQLTKQYEHKFKEQREYYEANDIGLLNDLSKDEWHVVSVKKDESNMVTAHLLINSKTRSKALRISVTLNYNKDFGVTRYTAKTMDVTSFDHWDRITSLGENKCIDIIKEL